ncbi:hypothetical protein [Cellulomonas sp. WB94]|uniref:hypothetical protein n=1 Tax=Cellulomonas sp. WB94 TaxID=2173174 RepID=UPI001304981A|nr:hypothetical protein [Cellulomonas sp. WB94]
MGPNYRPGASEDALVPQDARVRPDPDLAGRVREVAGGSARRRAGDAASNTS